MIENISGKQKIINAYLDLLKTKQFDKITVASVIRKADVNRSTFYRNFLDIYDLYENICEETADRIVDEINTKMKAFFIDGYSVDTLNSGYEIIYDVFVENKEIISLLAGKNGGLPVVKKFRDKCRKSMGERYPLFDESDDLEYQTGLLSDVSILFSYVLYTFRTGNDLLKLKPILPNTSLKKDFMSNILTVNDVLSDRRSEIEYRLIISAFNSWQKKKTVNLTVSDLTKEANVSRTEFYLYYKNIVDFYSGFEISATYVLAKYVMEVALFDEKKIDNCEFKMEDLSESSSNFLTSIGHTRLFIFLFRTADVTIDRYFQILKREYGDSYIDGNENSIVFYVCAVFIIVVRYATTGNKEQFLRSLKIAVKLKKRFENQIGFI